MADDLLENGTIHNSHGIREPHTPEYKMLFGHLPAGYITAKLVLRKFRHREVPAKEVMFWSLFGSIAPDTDLLYYHLIDGRQHYHHTYVTHFPLFWMLLFLISVLWLLVAPHGRHTVSALVFSLGGFIHTFLDTLVGNIFWLAPFDYSPYSFITFLAYHAPWVLLYFPVWPMVLELLVILPALYLWNQSRKKGVSCRLCKKNTLLPEE
jgi:inner membrane protein